MSISRRLKKKHLTVSATLRNCLANKTVFSNDNRAHVISDMHKSTESNLF